MNIHIHVYISFPGSCDTKGQFYDVHWNSVGLTTILGKLYPLQQWKKYIMCMHYLRGTDNKHLHIMIHGCIEIKSKRFYK